MTEDQDFKPMDKIALRFYGADEATHRAKLDEWITAEAASPQSMLAGAENIRIIERGDWFTAYEIRPIWRTT